MGINDLITYNGVMADAATLINQFLPYVALLLGMLLAPLVFVLFTAWFRGRDTEDQATAMIGMGTLGSAATAGLIGSIRAGATAYKRHKNRPRNPNVHDARVPVPDKMLPAPPHALPAGSDPEAWRNNHYEYPKALRSAPGGVEDPHYDKRGDTPPPDIDPMPPDVRGLKDIMGYKRD